MRYVSIPMRGMSTPTDRQISDALKLLNDPASGPVFVHCRRGADRTGAVIACYRIGHDHWDTAKAQDEANNFGMSLFQLAIRRYVARYNGFRAARPDPRVSSRNPAVEQPAAVSPCGAYDMSGNFYEWCSVRGGSFFPRSVRYAHVRQKRRLALVSIAPHDWIPRRAGAVAAVIPDATRRWDR